MTTEELIETLGQEPEDVLDEACHQAASTEASDANNRGVAAQIDYLIDRHGWGHEDILAWVRRGG